MAGSRPVVPLDCIALPSAKETLSIDLCITDAAASDCVMTPVFRIPLDSSSVEGMIFALDVSCVVALDRFRNPEINYLQGPRTNKSSPFQVSVNSPFLTDTLNGFQHLLPCRSNESIEMSSDKKSTFNFATGTEVSSRVLVGSMLADG
jgi:hypothetical protein